jgi:hypothetical protein
MGRKKSEYVCEKCGQRGFKRKKPDGVVHYDHSTRRRRTCYTKRLLDAKNNIQDSVSAEDPSKQVWGESGLYHKLRSTANHFHKIGNDLEKISMQVYKFKPNAKLSAQCVQNLEIFESKFLNPIEKLLLPYHDRRYLIDYSTWFTIQMDNFKYGPRAAGIRNAIPTGQILMKYSKDPPGVIVFDNKRAITSSQVKKNCVKTLKFAQELLDMHQFGNDLNDWSKI